MYHITGYADEEDIGGGGGYEGDVSVADLFEALCSVREEAELDLGEEREGGLSWVEMRESLRWLYQRGREARDGQRWGREKWS